MQDLSQRIASLSPERRRVLEVLLKRAASTSAEVARPDAATAAVADATSDELDGAHQAEAAGETAVARKARTRRFYDAISRQLATNEAGDYAYFLNFGYLGPPHASAVSLPAHYLNKNCVQLVLELIGDCTITGRRVLDVGCGRGGTVHVLRTFFAPASVVGVDLSFRAIAFCRKAQRDPRVRFLNGDAEALPLANNSVDVVTNVESSHSYPDVRAFYGEVDRLLRPDGYFLYTDLFPAFSTAHMEALVERGFELVQDRDITANVLASCDETARVHLGAFGSAGQHRVMNDFIGLPGSDVYEGMKSGRSMYRILKLRKPTSRLRSVA
jgi:SAM-dependent methyltransferase